ncbi:MAG: hypothetical protein LC126_25125 [Bryobacterales bacterium]|nr:hypothetical protein [Bryobacterales bacterium]
MRKSRNSGTRASNAPGRSPIFGATIAGNLRRAAIRAEKHRGTPFATAPGAVYRNFGISEEGG